MSKTATQHDPRVDPMPGDVLETDGAKIIVERSGSHVRYTVSTTFLSSREDFQANMATARVLHRAED